MYYKIIRSSDEELIHHGILGQKWGIRRYQNKDGSLTPAGQARYNKHKDDIVIKKGTQLNNLGSSRRTKLRGSIKPEVWWTPLPVIIPTKRRADEKKLFVYREDNEHDKNVYEGAFSQYVKARSFQMAIQYGRKFVETVYKRKYEATEDLVSPSQERRVELFIESFRKNPSAYLIGLYASNSQLSNAPPNLAPYLKDLYKEGGFSKNSSDEDLRKYAYGQFNMMNEWYEEPFRKANNQYYKTLKKDGYNALIDDNNAGKYNDAQEPLIVFDAKKRLKYIGTDELSSERITQARNTIEKYMKEKYNTGIAI